MNAPMWQMKELQVRDVKGLAHGHTSEALAELGLGPRTS